MPLLLSSLAVWRLTAATQSSRVTNSLYLALVINSSSHQEQTRMCHLLISLQQTNAWIWTSKWFSWLTLP